MEAEAEVGLGFGWTDGKENALEIATTLSTMVSASDSFFCLLGCDPENRDSWWNIKAIMSSTMDHFCP